MLHGLNYPRPCGGRGPVAAQLREQRGGEWCSLAVSVVSGQEALPEVSLGESVVLGRPSVSLTTALTLGPGVRGGISHLYDH